MAEFRLRDGTGSIRLKYIVIDIDRYGQARVYVRRAGRKKVRLNETPGTPAFMEEYRAALEGRPYGAAAIKRPVIAQAAPGTLRWMVEQYYACGEFRLLDVATRRMRRNILEALCREHGDKPVNLLSEEHIYILRDEKADTPHAANTLLKVLRHMFRIGAKQKWVRRNVTKDVEPLSAPSEGHHSWTVEEVKQFEEAHPIGTKARLAMALLLYTGQRRSDVVKMGPQHVRDGWLTFTQVKNAGRKPVHMSIPVLPELQAIIDATPSGHLAYLTTQFGKPYTAAGFGNAFRDWCNKAGLPHCSAHGLRKAAAAMLAERGATEHQIMAITGHRSLSEVQRYTRAARQKLLAGEAAKLMGGEQTTDETVQLSGASEKVGQKRPVTP